MKYHFTDREIEVIKLISCGQTNKEVAATLGIGVRTIETHRDRIKMKLGLNAGTAQITKYALAFGLAQNEFAMAAAAPVTITISRETANDLVRQLV